MDVERHVVAQDNIQIVTSVDEIPAALYTVAGKFFSRFDKVKCEFVSNIREQFPDD